MRSYRTAMLVLLAVLVTGIVTLIASSQDKDSLAAVQAGQRKKRPERLEDDPLFRPFDVTPEDAEGTRTQQERLRTNDTIYRLLTSIWPTKRKDQHPVEL